MLRFFEWTALYVFHGWLVFEFVSYLNGARLEQVLLFFVSIPLAVFGADLLTGIIHWTLDSVGNSKTPLWGPMLVKPFRDHHNEPFKITQISLAENLGSSAMAGLLVMAALSVGGFFQRAESIVLPFVLWFVGLSVWSNLFHRWAHIPLSKQSRWMRRLQRQGFLLSAERHAVHHRKPYRLNYCILNGWANVLTNRVPWWRLEAKLKALGVRIDFD